MTFLKNHIPSWIKKFHKRFTNSSLGSRLASGFIWSMFGALLSRSLGLMSGIFVARMLGKSAMGELGMVQSTVGMFSMFAGLGLGLTATKFVSTYRKTDPSRAGAIIGFSTVVAWVSGLIMTVVMMMIAPWMAKTSLAAPQLGGLLQCGSLLLFFGAVNGAQTGALSGFEAFKTIAKINWFAGLFTFMITVAGVYFYGLKGAVISNVISVVFNCCLNFYSLRKIALQEGVSISYGMSNQHIGMLFSFSLPGMLSWFISGPVGWATSAMLVNCPEGYAQMGIYNATNSWFQSVTFLPGLLAQVLLPILSGYVGANEKQKGKQALKISTIVNLLIVIPIVVIGSILSPWIMKLYGPKFIDGWPTLVLTFLAAGVLMIQSPITQQFIAHGRMWAYFGTHVLWGATFLVATHLMLPFGAVGLASGRLIAYVVNGLGFVVLAILYARSEKQTGNIT